jgi:Asp-tRNA(Asn)/Glu-tRNA(Gln) amidotransferase A subunit family amidase
VLQRIEWLNPVLNTYLTVTADGAREQARAAEDRALRGERGGPLDGIPYSIKDLEPTAGVRMTYGSKWFEHNVARRCPGIAGGCMFRSGAAVGAAPATAGRCRERA